MIRDDLFEEDCSTEPLVTIPKIKRTVKAKVGTVKKATPPKVKTDKVAVSDFYKEEFVDFASYSTLRMIGSAIDGMKNVHRKIINTVLDKNIKSDIKVSQLNSKVAEYTEYLHGDCSNAIAGMAQNFAGTNNLPLLAAEGNFGNRFKNDPSASRYIFTFGRPVLFDLIKKEDKDILIKQYFEGEEIEPMFYLPELPLLIVNGSSGIASGFSQSILPRDPNDILKYVKGKLSGKITKKAFTSPPSFNGFNGTVEQGDSHRQWKIYGTFIKKNTTTVEVTELPIGIDLPKYIKILEQLKDKGTIKDYQDRSNKNVFNFIIKFNRATLNDMTESDIMSTLKLIRTDSEVYNAVDENLMVRSFDTIDDIMQYYIEVKLKYLKIRKQHIIDTTNRDIEVDNSRYLFIKSIVDDELVISKRKTDAIIKDLDKIKGIVKVNDSYSYLLNMSIQSLTKEKMAALKQSVTVKKQFLKEYKLMTVEDIWLEDLKNIKI